ncbi:hypothetical protein RJT34_23046 [Clitoria ternatea]|uniref:DUF4218 domain-containing protein n=1 Tax=Clitoria ternatea TaxID=43366 RepID=A0AAN9FRD0_CLITE
MEHLPIHLPYEARIGGPVQYRWMYPFERFLQVEPYLEIYSDFLREFNPDISDNEINHEISTHFSAWFKQHVCDPTNEIL